MRYNSSYNNSTIQFNINSIALFIEKYR